MIDIAEVVRVLLERCETLPLPVAFPESDKTFFPPDDGRYYEVRFFPNGHAWEGVSNGSLAQGLLQINAVRTKNKGIVGPYRDASLAKAHFPKLLALDGAGVRVTISNEPTEGPALSEPSEVKVPVTIRWNATAI